MRTVRNYLAESERQTKLTQAIAAKGYRSYQAFAEAAGLSTLDVADLARGTASPINKVTGKIRPIVFDLMVALNKMYHELFDIEELEEFEGERSVNELRAESTFALNNPNAYGAVWQEEYCTTAELSRELERICSRFTPREKFVVGHRFGIVGEELSLEEVGRTMSVSRERVRQIETKALRKLRYPARSEVLRDFIEPEDIDRGTGISLKQEMKETQIRMEKERRAQEALQQRLEEMEQEKRHRKVSPEKFMQRMQCPYVPRHFLGNAFRPQLTFEQGLTKIAEFRIHPGVKELYHISAGSSGSNTVIPVRDNTVYPNV